MSQTSKDIDGSTDPGRRIFWFTDEKLPLEVKMKERKQSSETSGAIYILLMEPISPT
jgi:hypothetical protein